MARTPLQVEISFDHIHCYTQGDFGSAEPYLWTIFFKIDGDTVVMGDDQFLHGTATVVTTPGSHGNLGDTDVDEGDDVPVPSSIGEFKTTLKPIPVPDFLGVDDAGGVVGVVVVLMEEDWVTDSGAEAGHVALNNFVQQAIDQLIPTLGVSNPEVTDEQIADLAARALDAVIDAISSAQSRWHNFTSWLNGDDELGNKTFIFGHDSLAADAFQNFSQRLTQTITEQFPPFPPLQIVVEDWEIFGRVQGVQPCPTDAAISVLTKMKLLSAEDAREALPSGANSGGGRSRDGAIWASGGNLPSATPPRSPAFYIEIRNSRSGRARWHWLSCPRLCKARRGPYPRRYWNTRETCSSTARRWDRDACASTPKRLSTCCRNCAARRLRRPRSCFVSTRRRASENACRGRREPDHALRGSGSG